MVAVKLARAGVIVIEQRRALVDHEAWDKIGRPGIIRLRLKASESDERS